MVSFNRFISFIRNRCPLSPTLLLILPHFINFISSQPYLPSLYDQSLLERLFCCKFPCTLQHTISFHTRSVSFVVSVLVNPLNLFHLVPVTPTPSDPLLNIFTRVLSKRHLTRKRKERHLFLCLLSSRSISRLVIRN